MPLSPRSLLRRWSLGVCFAWMLVTPLVTADLKAQAPPLTGLPTAEPPLKKAATPIESLRARAEKSELEDDEKRAILDLIAQTETQITEALAKADQAEKQSAELEVVGKRAEKLSSELAGLADFEPETDTNKKLAALEADLASLETRLIAAKKAVSDAESAMKQGTQRRAQIDEEIPKLIQAVDERQKELDTAIASDDDSIASDVRIAELRSSTDLLAAQLSAGQTQAALIDAQTAANLPQLIRDLAARKAEILDLQAQNTKAVVETKRSAEASDRVSQANQELRYIDPVLKPIGEHNQELAELTKTLAAKIETTEGEVSSQQSIHDRFKQDFDQAIARLEMVGLTDAVGAKLRNLKQSMPNVGAYRMRVRARASEINDENFTLMDMTDQRNEKLTLTIDKLIREAIPPIPLSDVDRISEEAREMLQQQRADYLDPAIRAQTTYFNALTALTAKERDIMMLVEQATLDINKNVFWTRSTKPLYTHFIPTRTEWWFTLPVVWNDLWPRLRADFQRRSVSWVAAALAFLLLLRVRSRLREQISEIGQQVSKSNYTRFLPTLRTLFLTIAISIPAPLVFWFIGRRLESIAGGDNALLALTTACHTFAYSFFPLELMRQVCRTKGLAESHFEWPVTILTKLRKNLRMLLYIGIPLITVSSFLGGGSTGYGNDVLQRYFSIAAMVVLLIYVVRTMHPKTGAPSRYLGMHAGGWANRLSYIWYPLLVAIPIGLMLLTIVGYYFTSQQLGWRFFQSSCLLFLIGVVIASVMRWSLIHRRKLRMEQARERRNALETAENGAATEMPILVLDDSQEELQEQIRQSQSLFRTIMVVAALIGLSFVWSDVVPALGFFDDWAPWETTRSITEVIELDDGTETTRTRSVIDKVTITEIFFAMTVIIISFVAVRNIPGLLEFAILRRLPLDRSTRYAITTLISYAIVLLGLVISFGSIGVHWDQVQWMATALTFGLAFGLQEMFANFIAGIIILFEQPVRVGDVVEIDGIAGVVTKIRIRATTITDWDRKDYIVPNKEFITGKLLNWTRSDEVVRVCMTVGIAYGSDTDHARELLIQAAKEHQDVLETPPPLATFDGFGDNSLHFTLRVFVNTFEKRLHITHDLHTAVDKAFKKANIEISFPQTDLHVRTLPLEVRHFLKASANAQRDQPETNS